ncbi:MAG TPA: metallophosphoesterase [Gemmatimonadaceae bacterium]
MHRIAVVAFFTLAAAPIAHPQAAQRADSATGVIPIQPPRKPLPSEAASAAITKFSFIAYGDTRGRFDGTALQVEHGQVVESMLRTIKAAARGSDPIRFVLQSGDAVVSGREAQMLNVSYTPLVDRITTEGGVPYFLSVGNHDVTGSPDLTNPQRQIGLGNYFAAQMFLIPRTGTPHRLNGYPTYAFGFGNTFFLAFDSNIASDSVQYAWVASQLERLNTKRYVNIVAFFHHPVYSSGPHGNPTEPATVALRTMYMPLFRKHNVRLLLTGHEHFFEHFVEHWRDSTGKTHRMDQIVSGGGGAPTYTYKMEPDLDQYLADGARESVRVQHLVKPGADVADNPYHYLVVHVNGRDIRFEVIAADSTLKYQPYHSNRAVLSDTSTAR